VVGIEQLVTDEDVRAVKLAAQVGPAGGVDERVRAELEAYGQRLMARLAAAAPDEPAEV
jgi:hypothetical protein